MARDACPFSKGDRVRLKSGGPVLTVTDVYTPFYLYRVRCQWAVNGLPQADVFRVDELEAAPDEPDPNG